MLKRFVLYYKPYKKLFFLDMLATLFVSLLGLIYPIITRMTLNDFIPNAKYKMIIIFGIALLLLYLVRTFLRYFVSYYGHVMGTKMQADMRLDLFNKLQTLPFSYYDNQETGKIMSRMTTDLFDVCELAHHGPENIFISGIMIIGSFIYLAFIDIYLTLIIFVCVPILLVITLTLRKKMMDAFMQTRKDLAEINAKTESSISGIRVTKAFGNSKKEEEKFDEGNRSFYKSRCKAYKYMGIYFSVSNLVTDVFNVVVLLAGGLFLFVKRIDFADFSAFIVSVNIFVSPITTLISFVEQYQNGITGFKRFIEIVDEEPEKDAENAKDIDNIGGAIAFEHVNFSYCDEIKVLNDLSFTIDKGKKIALVGPSGGGKTTICHLIPRFYPVSEGKITIDGIDVREFTLASLRRNIGIVQQDIFLFNGTIKDNILYGCLDATNEQVIDAAKKANIHDYIVSLPDGYNSEIGERGVKLSGGQKQRISIARIILKNPSILILDEATSALDNTTELMIQREFDELCKGRTTLVVAHRMSTIRNADEILVIDNGKILEKGTHDSLLKIEGGIYKGLYEMQFKNYENLNDLPSE